MDIYEFIRFIIDADDEVIHQIEDFLAKSEKQADPLVTNSHIDCITQELL